MNALRLVCRMTSLPAVVEAKNVKTSKWRGTALDLCMVIGAIAVLALLIPGPQMLAQSSNAELSGVITDTSGAVVAGVEVKALNTATNVTYAGVTNGSGLYLLTELLPGPYTMTASAPGFGVVKHSGLKLSTGDHLSQNFTLKPGAVEESVTVTTAQTLISSDEASTADVLNNNMITELPQLNRNALDLTSTTPSIQGSGPQVDQIGTLGPNAYLIANTGNNYSISGGQVNGTSIYVDGNPVQEAEFNATNRSIPTPDSIGEFRVESGVLTADKGRYAGGIITMETQSGHQRVPWPRVLLLPQPEPEQQRLDRQLAGQCAPEVQPEKLRVGGRGTGADSALLQRHQPHLLLCRLGGRAVLPGSSDRSAAFPRCSTSRVTFPRPSSINIRTNRARFRCWRTFMTPSTAHTIRIRPTAPGLLQTQYTVRRQLLGSPPVPGQQDSRGVRQRGVGPEPVVCKISCSLAAAKP